MTSWPRVQFVDSPSVSATVRYDFNDDTVPSAPRWVANEGGDFTLGAPTLSGSPDSVGQSFGFRSPSFKQRVKGSKASALSALSALSRELLRPTNWLLFQLDASTAPVWLRIYRSGFEPLSLNRVTVNRETGGLGAGMDAWEIVVPLAADAFDYGARVAIPTAQVIQGPAALTGPTRTPMRVVLPAIKGDAPTPLRVSVTPTSGGASAKAAWLVGCISGLTTMSDPVVDIGTTDGLSADTGTDAGHTDAAYFNGSYRTVTIAAATPNLVNRLFGAFPIVPVGRYKVLLRAVYTGNAAKTLLFRLNQWPNGGSSFAVPGSTVTVTTVVGDTDRKVWVDLGDFNLPFGVVAPADGISTPNAAVFGLDIGTVDGSASSVNIDAFKLIPVDSPVDGAVSHASLLRSVGPDSGPLSTGLTGVFDGDLEQYWARTTSTTRYAEGGPSLAGGFPVADPAAAQNLLILMATDSGQSSGAGARINSLNAASTVDVSYYPRYLHIGDGS